MRLNVQRLREQERARTGESPKPCGCGKGKTPEQDVAAIIGGGLESEKPERQGEH
jgi:hypothetical protein